MSETTNGKLEQLAEWLRSLAENVRLELGCGFAESVLQNAFAIELRDNQIEYLKEVNIEIFYKTKYVVGTGRPDFVITKVGDHAESIIVELKQAPEKSMNADHRAQLKSYCTSFPLNHNPVLTNFNGGILLTFPKADLEQAASVQLTIVDRTSKVIRDDTKNVKLQRDLARLERDTQKAQAKQAKQEEREAKAAVKQAKEKGRQSQANGQYGANG